VEARIRSISDREPGIAGSHPEEGSIEAVSYERRGDLFASGSSSKWLEVGREKGPSEAVCAVQVPNASG